MTQNSLTHNEKNRADVDLSYDRAFKFGAFIGSLSMGRFLFQDKETGKIVDDAGQTVTITLIPTFIYDHIVKRYMFNLDKL